MKDLTPNLGTFDFYLRVFSGPLLLAFGVVGIVVGSMSTALLGSMGLLVGTYISITAHLQYSPLYDRFDLDDRINGIVTA